MVRTTSLATCLVFAFSGIATAAIDDTVREISEGNTSFAIELYKNVTANNDENIAFSPLSISSAMAMTL